MKVYFRTICVVFVVLLYTSCQKEVGTTAPTGNSPADSTATDSTITEIDSSLTILSFSPDSGRVGTLVTITGRGFDLSSSGNTVAINGTAAEVLSSTATGLVVQVKEGTTTGKISVTAFGKTVKSVTDFIVVNDSTTAKNIWVRKADVPSDGYTFNSGFSINNTGYFFNGSGLRAYDPVLNTWSQKKPLPQGYSHRYGFCFVVGSKAYVGLGAGYPGEDFSDPTRNKKYNDVWEYDAVQDIWTQKADFPGTPRVMPFSFSVNGYGYVGAGDTANGAMA